MSRLSVVSSTETNTIRHRRPDRSNTITSYHIPELTEHVSKPGAEPGIDTSVGDEHLPPHLSQLKADCDINIVDFSDDDIVTCWANNASLAQCLEQPRADDLPCRWICVNGLSWDVIKCIGNKFHLHRLAIEDLVHTHTRTKVDWYADHAFVVLTLQKLVRLHQHGGSHEKCDCPAGSVEDHDVDEKVGHEHMTEHRPRKKWWQHSRSKQAGTLPQYSDSDIIDEFVKAHSGISEETPIKPIRTLHRYESAQIPEHTAFMEKHSALAAEELAVSVEQVSIFLLADNTIISFFEHSAEDIEMPISERLQSTETILRRSCDASLMLQAIIDAIVDLAIPVKDAYNKARKELQVDAMTNPNIRTSRKLHIFGEEIDMLQNLVKPIVHLVNAIRDHNAEPLPPPPTVQPISELQNEDRPPGPGPRALANARGGAGGGRALLNRKISDFRKSAPKRAEPVSSVSISQLAHTYFGDVLDHCITMIQTLEQMDASASNISTLIFNTVGATTNNFMMILAVVTVFFAPLTFISGYFGMNFASGSGLAHPFSFFWIVAMPSLVGFMSLVFGFMLKENIRDLFAKRGIRAHRKRRGKRR